MRNWMKPVYKVEMYIVKNDVQFTLEGSSSYSELLLSKNYQNFD